MVCNASIVFGTINKNFTFIGSTEAVIFLIIQIKKSIDYFCTYLALYAWYCKCVNVFELKK